MALKCFCIWTFHIYNFTGYTRIKVCLDVDHWMHWLYNWNYGKEHLRNIWATRVNTRKSADIPIV